MEKTQTASESLEKTSTQHKKLKNPEEIGNGRIIEEKPNLKLLSTTKT
jgi:hypothetical protein